MDGVMPVTQVLSLPFEPPPSLNKVVMTIVQGLTDAQTL